MNELREFLHLRYELDKKDVEIAKHKREKEIWEKKYRALFYKHYGKKI